MSKTYHQSLGRWGEQVAAAYLEAQGYTILERNFRTPYGEIDLVAQHPPSAYAGHASQAELPVTVFVEVKTRTSSSFGLPEESVTAEKRAHLLASVEAYRQAHPDHSMDWRVDVIAIRRNPGGIDPELIHFENALS